MEIDRNITNFSSFWGIFWVEVSSPSVAKSNFTSIARLLGSSLDTIDDVLQLMSNLKTNWLLILDNADDPDFDYQGYIPSGDTGTIIMTSRVADCSRYGTIGAETLTSLGQKECVELLFKAAEIPVTEWPFLARAAENVVSDLSFHTLAIIQAGAYIARGHCSIEEFPTQFRLQHARLLQFSPKQAKSRYSHVFATFEASAYVLEENLSLEARDALCLLEVLAIFHFSELSMKIFQFAWRESQELHEIHYDKNHSIDTLFDWHVSQLPGFVSAELNEWDGYRLQEASNVLASLFLITKRKHEDFFEISMRSLVHAWARNRFNSEEKKAQAWRAIGSILSLTLPEIWHTQGRQLRPHVHSYLRLYNPENDPSDYLETIVPILLTCAQFLENMRDDKLLANLLKQIFEDLRIDSRSPSMELLRLLPLYHLQATNLRRKGHDKYSIQLLKKIVEIQGATLNKDHPDQLAAERELAAAYQANGQIKKAVQLLEHVFEIEETTLSEDHPSRLVSQHALAGAYKENGQIQEAVQLLEYIVKIEETALSEDHPSRLASQHALARAYQANGQIQKAVQLLERVVKMTETTLSEDHPSRLAPQHELARAYRANGQIQKAVQLLEHVVEIGETTLIEDHPDRLASQHELACAYQANGQIQKAVQLLEHVVKIRETTLSEDHPSRLVSQHELARAYQANGQIQKAVQLLEHVVKIGETTLSEDHHSQLASQHALADAYQANGQIQKAVQLLERVVEMTETTLSEDHPDRLASQHALARAYQANGQIQKAVQLLERVVKMTETTLSEDHPSRLAPQHELARAYRANGQIQKAVQLLEHVVEIGETMLSEDHPDRLASQHALAETYQANG